MEKISIVLAFLLFNVILYVDFFGSHVSLFFAMAILVVLLLLSYAFSRHEKYAWTLSKKNSALLSMVAITILMLLTVIFYLFGGRSQHGLNPTGIVIWFVYLLSMWQAFKTLKKDSDPQN